VCDVFVATFAMRVFILRWEKPALPYGELLWINWINQQRTTDIKSSCMRIGLGITALQRELPACYEISFCRRTVFREICYVILKKVDNGVTRSREHCCHGNARVSSLYIVGVHVSLSKM